MTLVGCFFLSGDDISGVDWLEDGVPALCLVGDERGDEVGGRVDKAVALAFIDCRMGLSFAEAIG